MTNAGKPTSSATAGRRPFGERRVITALFCDVVNSTTLAERLDPEDWAEIMTDAFAKLAEPVERYQGTINKLLGDGLLAFFGAPAAHEDDPQRAVLAGLDIIEAMKPVRDRVRQDHGLDFQVRVGINTGPVVVADVGSEKASDHTAMGDAVNVAARMEQTAAPGTVQISGETHRLVAPLFDFKPLGEIDLKGKTERVPAYQVLGVKARPSRLRGIDSVSAKLIGRDRELKLLHGAVDKIRQGRGQIVCIVGEAGLGKSRLLAELAAEWRQDEDERRWDVMAGIPYDVSRPYGLFQNFARSRFGVDLDDTAEDVHRKIYDKLSGEGHPDAQVALCSVAIGRLIAAKVLRDVPDYPAEVIKQDIYDSLYPAMRSMAAENPAVVVVDDLQWADTASVDLLLHLVRLVDDVPILFLCAFRPDRQSPAWRVKQKAETDFHHRYTEVWLKPLTAEDTDTLVSELLNIADLPVALRQLILRKAEGNPYFVEEVVRTLMDEGIVKRTPDGLHWTATRNVEDIHIPDTLQALLMARIDQLDQETKETLQLASVIGRTFYYRILKKISDSAIVLDKHLGSLERVELLTEASRRPELEYMFRHELARDAAYGSILNRRRRDFHRQVGEAIESLFPDRLEEHAHRLAQHFRLAGDTPKAVRYYEMAGDAALSLRANDEAADHFAHALEASAAARIDPAVVARLQEKRRTASV
jgi:class 3 adenylate cyclase